MSSSANPADPLGFDVKIGEDLDPNGRSASGLELVTDAMLHRLQCERLSLTGAPEDEVDFGEDVRSWVNEALSQSDLDARAPRLEEVIRRDPRIASATVSLTVTALAPASRYQFLIDIRAITTTGQIIDRIVGVSQVTVDFLAEGT